MAVAVGGWGLGKCRSPTRMFKNNDVAVITASPGVGCITSGGEGGSVPQQRSDHISPIVNYIVSHDGHFGLGGGRGGPVAAAPLIPSPRTASHPFPSALPMSWLCFHVPGPPLFHFTAAALQLRSGCQARVAGAMRPAKAPKCSFVG